MTTFRTNLVVFAALLSAAVPAASAVIDFETEAAGRGGIFTGAVDSPLTIGIATFTGGELLHEMAGLNANQTGVLATWLFTPAATNPLVITFALPVSQFSVQVFNGGEAQTYTVSNDLGESVMAPLPTAGAGGFSTFSLSTSGMTSVEILGSSAGWNFAIDNVAFQAIPEPGTAGLLAAAAGLFALVKLDSLTRKT